MYLKSRQENKMPQMLIENKQPITRKLSITGPRSITGPLMRFITKTVIEFSFGRHYTIVALD